MDTRINFTKAKLDSLPLPKADARVTYHDAKQAGLQLRVTANGVKTFSVFKRVAGGKPERVSLGRYPDITVEQARKEAIAAIAKLTLGKSPNEAKRTNKAQSLTFKAALEEYVAEKRRKDGLPLKARTKADYLAMVAPGRVKADKTRGLDGELFRLAGKPIHGITGNNIRVVHTQIKKHGERRAAYGMQVLRAVLNWHGVQVPDSPFDKAKAEKYRIGIPQARPAERAIPPERIGAWWNAANALPDSVAVDYLKFCLLTGCRPAEPLKVLMSDCDLIGGRVLLRDTKNRKDHTLALSTQALELVKRHAKGKQPSDRLFALTGLKKTVQALVKATGVAFSTKDLRATFANIAEKLATAYTLKWMMNHALAGDVTGTHYLLKDEVQMRAGWQAVADHIETQAAIAAGENVVQMPGRQVAT